MQYVPGLKPHQEEGQNAARKAKQGRVQTDGYESNLSLRPQAGVGQYYVRPSQPQRSLKAEQFIAALGQTSAATSKIGQYLYEKQQKEAQAQAQAEIQTMSLEEAAQKVQSGELGEYDNPYFQEAFQRQYGVRLGLHMGRVMRTRFETEFNPRTDSIDDFIASHLDPEMERMASNPTIRDAFVETLQEDVSFLRGQDYTEKAAAIEQDKLDGAYETGVAHFEKRLAEAASPAQRAAAIEEGYKAWRDGYAERQELLGLSRAEQDAITMQIAARFARNGDVDVVEKLLTDKRGGIGAIIDKRGEEGAKAAQILNLAERQFEEDNQEATFDQRMSFFDQAYDGSLDEEGLKRWYQENPGAMSEGHVRSLITTNRARQEARRKELLEERRARQLERVRNRDRNEALVDTLQAIRSGSLHNLESRPVLKDYDDDGTPVYEMLSREDQLAAANEYIQKRAIPQYAEQFPEEERGRQAFLYELGIYANNPELENEHWKRTLSNVSASFTAQAATGEVPPKIAEGYALYKNLKSAAPGMLDTLMSESDKDTYEALWYAEQYEGLELDQAVQKVYQIRQMDDDDNRFTSPQYLEMENAVQSLDGFVDGWGTPKNEGYVTSELNNLLRNQTRAGGSADIDTIVSRFKDEHQYINGWAVTTRGMNVPTNFKELAEEKIRAYAEEHADELEEKGLEADDLTIFPMGGMGSTGAWAIVDGTSANPMNSQIDSQFTLSELRREIQEKREQRAKDEAEEANASPLQGIRRRLLNQPTNESQADQDVWDIDLSEAQQIPESPVPWEDRPAVMPENARVELPSTEDPQVKRAVELARDMGMTKQAFDQYVREAVRDPRSGQGLIFSPVLRERIRSYLPTS